MPAIRAARALDTLPNQKLAGARVQVEEDSRARLIADVSVPQNNGPALLLVSRPYFDGYQARMGNKALPVDSYRGLIPTIRLPPGTEGRLTIVFRPRWLIWGGAAALLSALLYFVSLACACTRTPVS